MSQELMMLAGQRKQPIGSAIFSKNVFSTFMNCSFPGTLVNGRPSRLFVSVNVTSPKGLEMPARRTQGFAVQMLLQRERTSLKK